MARAKRWSEPELQRRGEHLAGLIRRAWRAVARSVAATLRSQGIVTVDDAGQVVGEWRSAVDTYVMGYVGQTLLDAGNAVYDTVVPTDGEADRLTPDLVEYYLSQARNRLVNVGDDVWFDVREQLVAGQHVGESTEQLALRVKHTAGVSHDRSLVIARTEIHAAHEAGSYEQARLLDPDAKKEWLATTDGRTRESHRLANGQIVKIGELFIVGGVPLRYPGDPLGDPSEIIQCRCSVAYDFDLNSVVAAGFDPEQKRDSLTGRWTNDAHHGIDPKILAIHYYAGAGFRRLNEALTRGNDLSMVPSRPVFVATAKGSFTPVEVNAADAVTHLDRAITASPLSVDTKLYRGTKATSLPKAGDIVSSNAYTSTSIDRKTAMNYYVGPGDALWEIDAPAGTHGLLIGEGPNTHEREVLLARGVQLEILKVTSLNDGTPIIHARVTVSPMTASLHCSDDLSTISHVNDLSDEMSVVAAGKWTPEDAKAHPRGHDGKFIDKNNPLLQLLLPGKSPTGKVLVEQLLEADQSHWAELKPEQQQHIYDLAQYADKYGIPGGAGVVKKLSKWGVATPKTGDTGKKFTVLPKAQRGKSGDGYAGPGLWGKYGAAGVIIKAPDDVGIVRYLLVQRGPMVSSNKGRWQLPGGAIDEHETPEQGAAREIYEEVGASQDYLDSMKHVGTHAIEVGDGPNKWVYSNIAAEAPAMFTPKVDGTETGDATWFTEGQILDLADSGKLHPALAKNISQIFNLYHVQKSDVVEVKKAPDLPITAEPIKKVTAPSPKSVKADDTIDLSHLKKVGGQQGSNPGGVFKNEFGDRYYVKKAKTLDHARNERAASQLYELAGVDTPEVQLGHGAPGLGGGLQTVTALVPGAKPDLKSKLNDPAYIAKLRKGFAVDAWLANWDVAGLVFDNVVIDDKGKPWRIDVGGTMLFRAQGAPKGHLFGDKVGEIDTLRDPKMNPQSVKIFGGMTDDEIWDSVRLVEQVTPEQIDKIIADAGLPASVAVTLKNRRADLIKRYPPLPLTTPTPSPTPVSTPSSVSSIIQTIDTLNQSDWNALPPKLQSNVHKKIQDAVNAGVPGAVAAQDKLDELSLMSAFPDAKPAAPKPLIVSMPLKKVVPAGVTSVTSPLTHPGKNPGDPVKVTTTLIWGKHPHGTVILAAGNDRVIWDESVKRYIEQHQTTDGTWHNDSIMTKKAAYEALKGDTHWQVPGSALKPLSEAEITKQYDKGLLTTDEYHMLLTERGFTVPLSDTPSPPAAGTPVNWSSVSKPALQSSKTVQVVAVSADGQLRVVWRPNENVPGKGLFVVEKKDDYNWVESSGPGYGPYEAVSSLSLWLTTTHGEWHVPPTGDTKTTPITDADLGISPGLTYNAQNAVDVTEGADVDSNMILDIAKGLTPSDWTLLTHAQQQDFTAIVNDIDPYGIDDDKLTQTQNHLYNLNLNINDNDDDDSDVDWDEIVYGSHQPGDVLTVSTDGEYQLIYAPDASGSVFVVLHKSATGWNDVDSFTPESLADHNVTLSDMLGNYPVLWKKPPAAATTTWNDATTTPVFSPADTPTFKSSVPTPVSYSDEQVISNWPGVDSGKYPPGAVVALTPNGKYRLVKLENLISGGEGGYQIQQFSPNHPNTTVDGWAILYTISKGNLPKAHLDDWSAVWIVPPASGKLTPAQPVTPVSTPSDPPGGKLLGGTVDAPTVTGDDTSQIAYSAKVGIQKHFKGSGTGKVGYWSKPEKIWDVVVEVQKKYPGDEPGHSKYTPLQILKILDEFTNTKTDTNPYENKIIKWANTTSGAKYIGSGKSTTPSVTPATPATHKLGLPDNPTTESNVNVAYTLKNNPKISNEQIFENLKSATPGQVLAYGKYEFSGRKYRLVASTATFVPGDDLVVQVQWYVPGLVTNGGWKNSSPYTSAQELTDGFKVKVSDGEWVDAKNAKIVAPKKTAVATTSQGVAPSALAVVGQLSMGSGDISHLTTKKKEDLFKAFRAQPASYSNSDPLDVYTAAKTIADENGLELLQMLRVIDEVYAQKKPGKTPQLFEKKILEWFKTPKGHAVATNTPIPKPPTPAFSSGVDPTKLPTLAESNKFKYDVISVSDTNAEWSKMIASHGADWTSAQRASLKTYTGGTYYSLNAYLYGKIDTISSTNSGHMKNAQLGMRPSVRPLLLHRGVGYDAFGVHSHDQLLKLVGQTRVQEGFGSTSVGGHPAFSKSVRIEVEAPPGTPMAWVKPISQHPSENEMLLGAGLNYHIISVTKIGGTSVVRARLVPA